MAEDGPVPPEAGGGLKIIMHYVYVLVSLRNGKKYTGYTRKSPQVRLKEHNQGSNTWTKQNRPFDLLYSEQFLSRKAALEMEKYLKSAAGRIFLKKAILGP